MRIVRQVTYSNFLYLKHGAGADIFTANMYLAEDRVSGLLPKKIRYKLYPHGRPDSLLGVGVETWWFMDSPLCKVRVCDH